VIGTMRQAIWALDPATSITDAGVMSVLMRDSEADDRFRALLVRTFAALATALAAVGIFGVTARGVATRTRELGIRAALGATGGGLVRLVVREGLASAAAGIALGLLGARAAAGGIRHLLFGVDPHDSGIFARVAVLALAVCVVAAWIPARRATRIDPRQAIAEE
jgi:ABC-type antimicrobial peptide transport system permease subunit